MAGSVDKNTNEVVTLGRRKRATARVRIQPGEGKFIVNGKPIKDYLCRDVLVQLANQPFTATDSVDKYDVRATCDGGGLTGQAGALRLGIARALLQIDDNLRVSLRKANVLTRDAREVERKKYGQPGARKRFQFSKR